MSAGKSRARYERHLAEWERSRKSITMPHDVGSAGHGIPSSKIKSRTAVVLESKSPWTAVGTTLISPDADSKATQHHISEEAISGNLDTNELAVGTLKMNDDGSNTEMEASEHIQADTDMDLEVAVEIGTAFESEYTKEQIEHDTQDPTESQS